MPTYHELQSAMTLLTGFTIGVGILVRFLPVGECDQCPHCRKARVPVDDPVCPLHKIPRSQCSEQH
jgi:hypothetical protein